MAEQQSRKRSAPAAAASAAKAGKTEHSDAEPDAAIEVVKSQFVFPTRADAARTLARLSAPPTPEMVKSLRNNIERILSGDFKFKAPPINTIKLACAANGTSGTVMYSSSVDPEIASSSVTPVLLPPMRVGCFSTIAPWGNLGAAKYAAPGIGAAHITVTLEFAGNSPAYPSSLVSAHAELESQLRYMEADFHRALYAVVPVAPATPLEPGSIARSNNDKNSTTSQWTVRTNESNGVTYASLKVTFSPFTVLKVTEEEATKRKMKLEDWTAQCRARAIKSFAPVVADPEFFGVSPEDIADMARYDREVAAYDLDRKAPRPKKAICKSEMGKMLWMLRDVVANEIGPEVVVYNHLSVTTTDGVELSTAARLQMAASKSCMVLADVGLPAFPKDIKRTNFSLQLRGLVLVGMLPPAPSAGGGGPVVVEGLEPF